MLAVIALRIGTLCIRFYVSYLVFEGLLLVNHLRTKISKPIILYAHAISLLPSDQVCTDSHVELLAISQNIDTSSYCATIGVLYRLPNTEGNRPHSSIVVTNAATGQTDAASKFARLRVGQKPGTSTEPHRHSRLIQHSTMCSAQSDRMVVHDHCAP